MVAMMMAMTVMIVMDLWDRSPCDWSYTLGRYSSEISRPLLLSRSVAPFVS